MHKLLVNAPSGEQQVIEVGEGGAYFDPARVVWDERVDGPLPPELLAELGSIVRIGDQFVADDDRLAEHQAATAPPIPPAVPALYGLLALDQAGMSAAYESWAADPARTFAERAFIHKALTWRRDNDVLATGAAALGLNSAQLDALFVAADALRIADAGAP